MPIQSFSPTGNVALSVSNTSTRVPLPTVGSPTTALLTATAAGPIYVQLGDLNVVAVEGASLPVLPGQQIALTIGANTHIAAVSHNGGPLSIANGAGLNITLGV